MRIRIKIKLNRNRFPADYRRAMLHLLKKALSAYQNGAHFQEFFPEGKPQRKEYAFAVGLPRGSVCRGDSYDLGSNKITLLFTTGNMRYFTALHNSFKRLKGCEQLFTENVSGQITALEPIMQEPVQRDKIFIRFQSPLCVREHIAPKDRYYSIGEPEFCDQLRRVVSYQLADRTWATDSVLQRFRLYPLQMKKTVARFYGQQIPCTLGTAVLFGEPQLLTELYYNGIGSRCSSGFGVFDLI